MLGSVLKKKVFWVSVVALPVVISSYILGTDMDIRFWGFLIVMCTGVTQTINFFEGRDLGIFGPAGVRSNADVSDRATYIVLFDLACVYVLYMFVEMYWLL